MSLPITGAVLSTVLILITSSGSYAASDKAKAAVVPGAGVLSNSRSQNMDQKIGVGNRGSSRTKSNKAQHIDDRLGGGEGHPRGAMQTGTKATGGGTKQKPWMVNNFRTKNHKQR
jgi:hypothetical protein